MTSHPAFATFLILIALMSGLYCWWQLRSGKSLQGYPKLYTRRDDPFMYWGNVVGSGGVAVFGMALGVLIIVGAI
jgi:hypothetical protein